MNLKRASTNKCIFDLRKKDQQKISSFMKHKDNRNHRVVVNHTTVNHSMLIIQDWKYQSIKLVSELVVI